MFLFDHDHRVHRAPYRCCTQEAACTVHCFGFRNNALHILCYVSLCRTSNALQPRCVHVLVNTFAGQHMCWSTHVLVNGLCGVHVLVNGLCGAHVLVNGLCGAQCEWPGGLAHTAQHVCTQDR
jgi:hypothetical protein